MTSKIVFLGTPKIAVSALKSLNESDDFEVVAVVTNNDQFFGRSRSEAKPSAVKEYAVENNLQLIQSDNINEDIDKLKEVEHDYLITCAFGQFLNEGILSLPNKKALNIHASLLPEGRGGAPIH
jgi:methionyl-tRNA formyltransferase